MEGRQHWETLGEVRAGESGMGVRQYICDRSPAELAA